MPVHADRWIGDYRAAGLVDWPPALRESIAATKRTATKRALRAAAIPPALVLITGCIGIAADPLLSGPMPNGILITAAITIGIATVVCILRANDHLKVRGVAVAALHSERLERFELAPHVAEEAAAAKALGIDASTDHLAKALYIAPSGSLVLQVDEQPLPVPQPVFISSIPAPPPTPAASSAGRQALSPAELAELRSMLAEDRRPTRLFPLFYSVVSLAVVITGIRFLTGHATPRNDIFFITIIPILWLSLTYQLVGPLRKRRRIRRLLQQDLEAAYVEVLDGHHAVDALRRAGLVDPRAPMVNPGVVRRLPHSGFWWEVDGVPGYWRRG